jgi:hypothetical protein
MNGASGDERKRLGARSVAEFEQALRLTRSEPSEMSLRIDLAKNSFEAGQYEKARGYASEVLDRVQRNPRPSGEGNTIHDGNLVLGRLALVAGDVAAAKRHLLAAGATPGSPNLNSFGPNMSLAKELRARRDRDCTRIPQPLRQVLEARPRPAQGVEHLGQGGDRARFPGKSELLKG